MPGAAQGLTGKLLSFLGLPGKSPPESHLLWWSRWSARVLWNASANLTSCHPWQQSPANNSFLSSNFHISQECLSLAKSHLEPNGEVGDSRKCNFWCLWNAEGGGRDAELGTDSTQIQKSTLILRGACWDHTDVTTPFVLKPHVSGSVKSNSMCSKSGLKVLLYEF